MVSERMQRRLEALLDDADAAVASRDWQAAGEHARAALAIDPENVDALTFLRMSEANLGASDTPSTAPLSETPAPAAPSRLTEQPTSFAGGRYEVRRFLGEGGKKRVFLAHDTRLDRDVAFALIKTEGLDATGRERITREAQAMGRLGAHPHIVTIFEIGEEAGSPYVVNELLGGGDVEGELERSEGALPLARTLEIAKGVCRGLAFAHERGIVHRDLKPGNVWLTEDGTAKIGDFGLAVSLDRSRLTQHGMMVGTVAYMPPEQALGGEVTPQADLYSLGAMLYELMTGRPPFQADDPTAIISQHINTPPVRPSLRTDRCPPDLEALVLCLLAKAPSERPDSASGVLAILESIDPEARSARDSQINPLERLARGVFVGRETELERLRGVFDEAFAGRGSVAMLVGEPGIGKTRTAQELGTYARMRGGMVLWGRAHNASGAPAYWPWVQIGRAWGRENDVRALSDAMPGAGEELARLFPELPGMLGQATAAPPATVDEATQFRLYDAYTRFLAAASRERPIVAVLDDLHWADKPSLLLLQHLARELADMRVLVVGTYRDAELARTHPLTETLAELNREDGFQRVVLRGLSETESRAYLAATTGREPDRELARRMHDETEGNPFFLAEVVNLMTEEGTLDGEAGKDVRLPDGVREALGRRLDRLPKEANELFTLASVVGRDFEYETLKRLTSSDDDTLLSLLEGGLATRVIEERERPGQYRFTHALMQETLLSALSTTRVVRLHGRIAEVLEAQLGERAMERAAVLATHFVESATLTSAHAEKAVRYSQLAGAQAEAVTAWDEATRNYKNAVSLLEDTDHARVDEGALWEALGRAQRNSGDFRGAWGALQRALAAYREAQDPLAFARAALETQAIEAPEARVIPMLDAAIAGVGDADDLTLARLLAYRARFGDSVGVAAAGRARSLIANADVPDVTCRLLAVDARGALRAGRLQPAASMFYEAYRKARDADRLGLAVDCLIEAVDTVSHAGDLGRQRELAAELLSYSQTSHLAIGQLYGAVYLGFVHQIRGEWSAAFEAFDKSASSENWSVRSARCGVVEITEGPHAALSFLPDQDDPVGVPPSYRAHISADRMRVSWRSGRDADAHRELQQFLAHLHEAAAVPFRQRDAVFMAAEALVAIGERSDCQVAYDILRTGADRLSFGRGVTDVERGRLALRLGLVDDAEQHFRMGIEWCERERCPVEAGRCHQGLAEVAERQGDHALAMQHLDAAGELFSRHGAKLYLDQVLAKKEILKA